jgi:two-component system chemotaxis sensor kinase CheA
VGLGVQKVEGFHQAVIKPLGRAYRDIKDFSGSTILGDGRVALILDIQYLISERNR